MDKLGRNYVLRVQDNGGRGSPVITGKGFLEFTMPLTMEFDIKRALISSANVAQIRVLNLAEGNQVKLAHDIRDWGTYQAVELRAGYGTNLPTIFKGNVRQCWSVREKTETITTIECYDGGFAMANAFTATSVPEGDTMGQTFARLISDLPGIKKGVIGSYTDKVGRPMALNGGTADQLAKLSEGGFFIDLETAHVLGENECIQGQVDELSSDSGLLSTPVRETGILRFDMIFEPRLIIGQRIFLKSKTARSFNGFYKVQEIHHKGTISAAQCREAVTSVTLSFGTEALEVVA